MNEIHVVFFVLTPIRLYDTIIEKVPHSYGPYEFITLYSFIQFVSRVWIRKSRVWPFEFVICNNKNARLIMYPLQTYRRVDIHVYTVSISKLIKCTQLSNYTYFLSPCTRVLKIITLFKVRQFVKHFFFIIILPCNFDDAIKLSRYCMI